MASNERPLPKLVVVERDGLGEKINEIAERLKVELQILPFSSVLEVVGESGPASASGLICSVSAAGPFLKDLLRWTEPGDHRDRISTAVIGKDSDESAIDAIIGRDHVQWINAENAEAGMESWLSAAMEVYDLRLFRAQHNQMARTLREARTRLFAGDISSYVPEEGPPCGPPLPTHVEEIQALREARAQYERGLIRSAIRQFGSLKDASAALGISYTSLWRRLR